MLISKKHNKIIIDSIEGFDLCLKKGINPLFWHRIFKLEINLRVDIQNKLFGLSEIGKVNIIKSNEKYYRYCYNHSNLSCENCGKKVYSCTNIYNNYSSVYISHILSRGSNPKMAHDPRNHNVLCLHCHNKWEFGNKKEMLIYFDNLVVIDEIKRDYYSI